MIARSAIYNLKDKCSWQNKMQDGLKSKMLGMKMKLFRGNYHDSDNTNVQKYSRTYGFYKRLLTACIREDFKCKAQLQSPGQMFMFIAFRRIFVNCRFCDNYWPCSHLIKSKTTKMILPIEKMSEKYFVCFRSQFLCQFAENSFCIPVAFSLS